MSSIIHQAQPSDSRGTRTREISYLILVLVPPTVLTALLTFGILGEWFAERQVQQRVAALLRDGEPIGNASMTASFDQSTTKATSHGWKEIIAAADGVGAKFGEVDLHLDDVDGVVPPGEEWIAAPFVNAYASESTVIVDAIERLADSDDKVWMPLLFDGYQTRLPEIQDARTVTRLLIREFRDAYHVDDHRRAIRALKLLQRTAQAFDWDSGLIVELVHVAIQSVQRGMIRESLRHDFWTADDLSELREILSKKDDLDNDWRKMVSAERATILAFLRIAESGNLESGSELDGAVVAPFGLSPVHQFYLLDTYAKYQNAAGGDEFEVSLRLERLSDAHQKRGADSTLSLTSIPFANAGAHALNYVMPAWQAVAYALVRRETERRWVLTAVAIKQFKLQEQRWPENLKELTLVGLSPADWHVTPTETFGYRIEQDNQSVKLWSIDIAKQQLDGQLIPRTPYSESQPEYGSLDSVEVQIR